MSVVMGIWMIGAALAAAAPQPPLQPSGKWAVAYEPGSCVLSRTFGTGDAAVTLAIMPSPVTTESEIMLVAPAEGAWDYVQTKGFMTIGARQVPTAINTFISPKTKQRLTRLYADESDLAAARSDAALTLPLTATRSVTLQPRGIVAALEATRTCRADLRKEWGLDEASRAKIVTPARPIVTAGDWLNARDYPPDVLRAGVGGVTTMLWAIGIDGRVADCRIVKSSLVKQLDEAACAALKRRARYTPALDAAGQPIQSWSSRTVRWQLSS